MNPSDMPYLTVTAAKPEDGACAVRVVLDTAAFLKHRDGRSLVRKALARAGLPSDSGAVDAAISAMAEEAEPPPRTPRRRGKPAEVQ